MTDRVLESLEVLYADDALLVVFKPAWVLVHRGMGTGGPVLTDAVRQHLGTSRVFPLHRLDRQTSGPVLFAQTAQMAQRMQAQFADGRIHKSYRVLVRGTPPAEGEVDSLVPVGEDGPRVPARTRFFCLETVATQPRAVSLVRAEPLTGRFHQIRRHMKHIHCPVIGDANYGRGDLNRAFRDRYGLCRMALHAERLSFEHPDEGHRIEVLAPMPADLRGPLAAMGFSAYGLR